MADITGTNGRDTLTGARTDDEIDGQAGADRIRGGDGADRLSGGDGGDRIFGGAGDDVLLGHGAADLRAASGQISVARVETGVERLVFAATAPGDPQNLYLVAQRDGAVTRFDPETGAAAEFLRLPEGTLDPGGEGGLLGLAFHPDYETNGRFFLHLVNAAGDVEIKSFTRDVDDPTRADGASDETVLIVPHPDRTNHNGGTVAFGPDGFLYISVGDGGGGGDPDENAQDVDDPLGSILRIDVDGDDFPGDAARNYAIPADNPFADGGGAPEIWDFGLRNPFRFSFDPATGDLVIGDVGQSEREEIDLHPAGTPGGLNFGWDILEGTLPFETGVVGDPLPGDPSLIDPIFEYSHDVGFSVTGGVFIEAGGGLNGAYVFADFVTDKIWSLRIDDGEATDVIELEGRLVGDSAPEGVAAFANGPDDALYAVSLDGGLSRLTIGPVAGDGGDTLNGGAGADELRGGFGDDRLLGGAARDRLFGGDGDDTLHGGDGGDMLQGGRGGDRLLGGGGVDALKGRAGADHLHGGGGADRVIGGGGGDTILGGRGQDELTGGRGRDVFEFGRDAGRDTITDFTHGVDLIDLGALASGFGDLAIRQAGDDVVIRAANVRITALDDDAADFSADDFLF